MGDVVHAGRGTARARRGNPSMSPANIGAGTGAGVLSPLPRSTSGDVKEEIGMITTQLDIIEQRISDIRESLKQLD